MATIINNRPEPINRYDTVERDDRGLGGFLVGLAVLIILAILLFAFGIPALRRSSTRNTNITPNLNITPGTTSGGASGSTGGSTSGSGTTSGGTGTGTGATGSGSTAQ